MRTKANKLGLIFLATASVYSGGAAPVGQSEHAKSDALAGSDRSTLGTATAAPTVTPTAEPKAGSNPGFYFTKAAMSAPTPVAVAPADEPAVAAPHVGTPPPPTHHEAPAAPVDAPIPVEPISNVPPLVTNEVSATDPFSQTTTVIDPGTSTNSSGGRSVTTDDVDFDGAAGTVEIHVNEASLVEVLRMLSLQSQKNIIASKEVKGTVTANLYGVTVREALDAILTSNGFTFREEGNFIYVYTAQELAEQRQATRVRKTQVFRLYYTPVSTAVNMIKPVLSKDGEVAFTEPAAVGLSSGDSDAGGNSHSTEDVMVVTDYEDQLAEVKRVLAEIDRRPQQILIEATILRATLNEDNALGVDFQVLGGVDFSGLTASSGGNAGSGSLTNGQRISSVSAGAADSGASYGGTGFTNNVPKGGLQVGLIKNNIAVFLEALETVTDTTVLANPKILALNKQKGEVIVGREDGYVTSTTTNTATVQTVEFLQTGTRLIFRPYIGDDGYVRMEIHPEDSSGGLTGANLPFKVTTEVTSNVLVRDGHTVVIGGLFREDSNSTRGQVPGLGNLPFAGALFRSQRDRTTREEIIILLTPHIVKDEVAFSQMSEDELQRMDQLRLGVRRGMMPIGRERLAEGFYDSAMRELDKPTPNRGRVLWNLNAATNLNPKFLEAIELKQQLTQREVTGVDNATSRDFVRRLALADLNGQRIVPRRLRPLTPRSLTPTTVPTVEPTTNPSDVKLETDRPDTKVVTDESGMPTTQPVTPNEPTGPTPELVMAPATQPTSRPVLAATDEPQEIIWPQPTDAAQLPEPEIVDDRPDASPTVTITGD